jgi:NitT/TauT family transport system ATP-binding protein
VDKITMKNVDRVYRVKRGGNRPKEFVAIKGVNLSVKKGEFLAIVGPSGCGKSTLLDMLAGLAPVKSGEIFIDGKLMNGPDLDRGIILQGYALFPWRSVRQNVELGLEIKGVPQKARAAISEKYINLVGLQGFADRFPYELSGGMKQRVAIARALAYDPEVLLMDEPFAAVDAQTRETLQDELLLIWEKTKKTIVFVTHSIDEAVFLSDRVAVMTVNPGTIKEVVDIKLPRPRNGIRTSAEFNRTRQQVWELLQNDPTALRLEKNYADGQDVAELIYSAAVL